MKMKSFIKIIQICSFPNSKFLLNAKICGKNHSCFGKITHVWNLPINKTSSKCLDKSTHVWEKPLSISILMKWENQTCVAFIKHIPNTKVCGKRHTCLKKTKHVCLFPNRWCYFLYLHLYLSY